jgi:cell division protein FtsI/penicillin-binding protein 2
VVDARRGSILALVSAPEFLPLRIDEEWETLRGRLDAPLLNRATQAAYQPGLVLAPIFLAWGERLQLVQTTDPVVGLTAPQAIDDHRLPCAFSPPPETRGTLAAALRFGCPTAFSNLGAELGGNTLEQAIATFGFGEVPLEDLESARPLVLERVLEGADPSRLAVGQEEFLVTPLQVARAFAALAANGRLPDLRLILETQNGSGEWLAWGSRQDPVPVVSSEVAGEILESLRRDPQGNVGFGAYALGGPRGELLAWYIGISQQGETPMVAVAVLEAGTTAEAGAVVLAALGLPGEPAPP